MKLSNTIWTAGVLCALVPLAGLSVWAAEPPRTLAPPPGPARPTTAASASSSEKNSAAEENELMDQFNRLELKAAQTYVRLTELDLQKITDMNEKMARVYSNVEVDNLRAAVDMAKERVRVAKEVIDGNNPSGLIEIAAIRLKAAERTYNRAQDANKRLATAFGPLDIERLKMAVESARIDLEKAKVVAKMDSPLADMHLEFDQLREEVRQLRYRIVAITSRR